MTVSQEPTAQSKAQEVGGKMRGDGFTSVRRRTLHSDVPKPHECTICNSKFTRYHNLKQHIKLHSGIKPYQCEHCGKRFTRNYTLRLHKMKVCNAERLHSRGSGTESATSATENLLRNLQLPNAVPSLLPTSLANGLTTATITTTNLSQLLKDRVEQAQSTQQSHFAFDNTLLGPGVKEEQQNELDVTDEDITAGIEMRDEE